MKVVKIVVLLSLPDDVQVTVQAGTATAGNGHEAPPPATPAPKPAPRDLDAEASQEAALDALRRHSVEKPERWAREYAPGRILEVCEAVTGPGKSIKNPAAWVTTALSRGWKVGRKAAIRRKGQ